MNDFNIEDTAIILINHQVGTITWARTTPLALLQRNVKTKQPASPQKLRQRAEEKFSASPSQTILCGKLA